ncbi:FAD protein [Venustampulla echinocandica]|uniref:FAD protein n=1 Tax=Venustampulla echinocandica TaxID=2656787 RepID=A0A370TT61_9HELO|nr:FAD protein [Venustampulla echinocandica]RDL38720.1 FAD protein [Venustampulla echinocandica]
MASDTLRFVRKYWPLFLEFTITLVAQRIKAFTHRFTYHLLPTCKNVVVLGGSFSGAFLARRLGESLPSGYKVILIEKNSHFNFCFNFPRYSVVQGHEQNAFIPYDGLASGTPAGIFEIIRDTATGIRDEEVELASGKRIPFAYLAVATGALQPPPARLLSSEKNEACAELKALQDRIIGGKKIGIIGGGAVGVQLAGDIKSFYPDKHVVLIHSRDQLLPSFGVRLHKYVVDKLQDLGVELMLGERPAIPSTGDGTGTDLVFPDGRKETFDVIVPCIGQIPNSSILDGFSPSSISPQTRRILVESTLQLRNGEDPKSRELHNVFALGDVAETDGYRMARSGAMQAEVVRGNIIALINDKELEKYSPIAAEGGLKLSLGKDEYVMYVQDPDGTDFLIPGKSSKVDLEVEKGWKMFGAKFKKTSV